MELLAVPSGTCSLASFTGLRLCTRQSPPSSSAHSAVNPWRPLRVDAEEYNRRENRKMKHARLRRKLSGTSERPRLAVFRSNQHLYCQVIDDIKMHTLAAMSTIQKPLRDELDLTSGPTIEAAKRVGEEIAKLCLKKGISKVAFDRGGFEYHGRIKALAEAAREQGLEF